MKNRNEVIAALRCCKSANMSCSDNCPYFKEYVLDGCMDELLADALALLEKDKSTSPMGDANKSLEENNMENCCDNRLEIIKRAKEDLVRSTNISGSPDEMKVLDNILFRAWQMGWINKYEPDYKKRMKEEYWQIKDRYTKLHKMCIKYEAGTLDFTPTCSLELLKEQKAAMGSYLHCLEVRAEIEGVAL